MRFLALAHFKKVIPELTLPLSQSQPHKCQPWVSNFLLHGVAGLDSVRHQADPPSSAPNSYPSLANISTNKAGWPSGDDCKVLIFKRISNESLVWPMNFSNVHRLLRELGFSWITGRSRHPKQDGQVQSF